MLKTRGIPDKRVDVAGLMESGKWLAKTLATTGQYHWLLTIDLFSSFPFFPPLFRLFFPLYEMRKSKRKLEKYMAYFN